MRLHCLLVLLYMPAACLCGAETDPAFTRPPTTVRDGDTLKIGFAVDRITDVAVPVENAQGKTIRHLTAGVLGTNPPQPLKANSLLQSLVAAGKDDAGQPVAGGPVRVRVNLGMRAEFDRFLLYRRNERGPISCAAVGSHGSLYVFHRDETVNITFLSQGQLSVSIKDRQGNVSRIDRSFFMHME